MHISHKTLVIGGLILAAILFTVAGLAIKSSMDAAVDKAHHDEQIKSAEAIQKVNDRAIADNKDAITKLMEANKQISADAKQQIGDLQKSLDHVTTAAQAAANMRAAFPNMQQPITREAPAPGAPPDAPGMENYKISGSQLQTFYACGIGKQQCEIRAKAAEDQVANLAAAAKLDADTIAKKDSNLAQKDKEIKAEKDLNHGGSLGRRIRRKIKPVLCGAGGAALGVLFDKNHPARGAAVGSITGGVACSIF